MNAYAEKTAANVEPNVLPTEPGSALERELHLALESQTFTGALSPQARRGDETPAAVTFELALVRGTEELRLGKCEELIEAAGLRTRLDHYAIRAACRYLACADSAPRVSVKVAAETLAQNGCAYLVDDAASSAGVDVTRLELEIEEHALHWRGDIEPTLSHLSDLGVRIAIDRFGTGLTSLSALAHLPIATIKIDESIVAQVTADEDVANYARAIIDVARHMRLNVVVVGATSQSQRAFFEGAGCMIFQNH